MGVAESRVRLEAWLRAFTDLSASVREGPADIAHEIESALLGQSRALELHASITSRLEQSLRAWAAPERLESLCSVLEAHVPTLGDADTRGIALEAVDDALATVYRDEARWPPKLSAYQPEPAPHLTRWAVIAFVGGAIGAYCGSLLANAGFDQPGIGSAIGGPLGAALCVYLMGRLARWPRLTAVLLSAVGIAGTLQALRALIPGFRSLFSRQGVWDWLRWLALSGGAVLLLWATRSEDLKPIDEYRRVYAVQVIAHARAFLLLVTTLCVSAAIDVAEQAVPTTDSDDNGEKLVGDLRAGLDNLFIAHTNQDATLSLHSNQQLLSLLAENGIVPILPETGAPFTGDMQHRFDTFGNIEERDPVECIRPAWVRGERTLARGQVRRRRESA